MKQWTERDCTSQAGIAKLFRVVTDMGYIWRPTPNSDVGLDGEIELVEDRAATAKIIKVQVKSGVSYFRNEDQHSFEYHGSKDDLAYWLKATNPVLLVMFHADPDCLYALHVQRYVETHLEAGQTGVLKFGKNDNLLASEHAYKFKQIVFNFGASSSTT